MTTPTSTEQYLTRGGITVRRTIESVRPSAGSKTRPRAFRASARNRRPRAVSTMGGSMKPRSQRV